MKSTNNTDVRLMRKLFTKWFRKIFPLPARIRYRTGDAEFILRRWRYDTLENPDYKKCVVYEAKACGLMKKMEKDFKN